MLDPDALLDLGRLEPFPTQKAGLTPQLLELLHEPRSILRERSYAVLATWLEKGIYEADLETLGDTFAQNLSLGLGAKNGNEAFVRAYSSLLLGEVIGYDAKHRTLSEQTCHIYFEIGLDYMQRERDTRGFVSQEQGWVHASAHGADLLMQLANHPLFGATELKDILATINQVVRRLNKNLYLNLEDERLAYASVNVLKRKLLSEDEITSWLANLTKPFDWGDGWREGLGEGQLEYAQRYSWWPVLIAGSPYTEGYTNIRSFARSLYFQLELGTHELDSSLLESALRQLDTCFYNLP